MILSINCPTSASSQTSRTDCRPARHVLKFIEFIAPRLPMGDRFALQGDSAAGAYGWFEHRAILGLSPPPSPRIQPFGGIISVDGYDVNTVAIKRAETYSGSP
jgi:hypothetical protein